MSHSNSTATSRFYLLSARISITGLGQLNRYEYFDNWTERELEYFSNAELSRMFKFYAFIKSFEKDRKSIALASRVMLRMGKIKERRYHDRKNRLAKRKISKT